MFSILDLKVDSTDVSTRVETKIRDSRYRISAPRWHRVDILRSTNKEGNKIIQIGWQMPILVDNKNLFDGNSLFESVFDLDEETSTM